MNLYPLLTVPHFLSGEKTPWGGNMLRDAFMKDAPEQTGASLEVSALEGMECMIRSGAHAAKTLSRMTELFGKELTGCEGAFPLVQKLIDVCGSLPRQTAESAKAWIVLNCDAGCKLTCNGAENALRPGDVYYIPAGAEYAFDAGVQLYEVCAAQAENAAAATGARKIYGATSLCRGGSRTYYAANGCFELCRLNLSGKMPLDDGRMHVITPLAPCTLRWAGKEMTLMPLESVIIPAGLKDVFIENEDCKLFCASPSDREWLKQELGYRAENVAGLCE